MLLNINRVNESDDRIWQFFPSNNKEDKQVSVRNYSNLIK